MEPRDRLFRGFWLILRVSLITLPYVLYASMLGIFSVLMYLLIRFRRLGFDPVTRYSMMTLSGLLALGVVTAHDPGEAFLQLANFLPFFVLFGLLPLIIRGVQELEQIALDLVLATIPINLIAAVEYALKVPWMPRDLRRVPFIAWVRSAPHKGRAMVMFDHPNSMANYLVLMLGLGLGLLLHQAIASRQSSSPSSRRWTMLLYSATFLNLVGIFASGSRNALVIAMIQLLIFSSLVAHRLIRWLVVVSMVGLLTVVAVLGIGGRSLIITSWLNDPRIRVWQIALTLTQQRPWLGWGLGNYKILYPSFPHDPDYPIVYHPHNVWLLFSSEAGILVMLGFTLLVGYLCYRAVRLAIANRTPTPEGAIAIGYLLSFLGCIVFALFDVPFFDARINVINWLLLAGIYTFTQHRIR